jgi:hypothetical protein
VLSRWLRTCQSRHRHCPLCSTEQDGCIHSRGGQSRRGRILGVTGPAERAEQTPADFATHTSLSAARHRHAHRALDGGRTNALSRLPASERPGPRSLRKFANMENSVGVAQARGERPVHVAPHAPHSLFSLYGFCMSRVQMHSKWARGRARKELIDWGPRGERRGWPGATWVHIFGLGDFADTGPRDASVPP